ncbi:nucleoside triphosphate hydrolase [Aureimonas ureilytica]|uniref:Nucleoside triphosphate hydrolase n=1 Tax=Aureimonas ureilytica TaxID=401562 RepID=A0A175R7C4_9HYPH|nr:nucleoside triphosphate pyrophosphohydrolase [Aureimonas ureilytica]KTQ88925.1 nucleoside triphosphate hydrolase [Aureimonas ureilytica]
MQPSRDTMRLVEIMKALRHPETGCPWDIEQSFDSIIPYTIEETYEVVDAIERRDPDDLKEELGDLLLQVIYYSQLADEAGLFSYEDVVDGITRKMIRRHPHVFGDASARNARSAKGQWERIKAEEKQERAEARMRRRDTRADTEGTSQDWSGTDDIGAGLLSSIPGALPSLTLARKIQEKAATVGFDWTTPEPIIAKLREETAEFEAAANLDEKRDELGDLLFTLVNLGRRYDIDPDAALRGTVSKFRSRFRVMERAAASRGRSLSDMSLDELETHWVAAKAEAHSS